jgi:hypothetical protein
MRSHQPPFLPNAGCSGRSKLRRNCRSTPAGIHTNVGALRADCVRVRWHWLALAGTAGILGSRDGVVADTEIRYSVQQRVLAAVCVGFQNEGGQIKKSFN